MFRLSLVAILLFAFIARPASAQSASDNIYQAIRNNDLPGLRTLIKDHGADLKDSRGQTPLMIAAAFGSLEAMKLLIAEGASVKAESDAGVTALHWCAGDIKKVQLLLDQGADVNKATLLGRTPLVIAAATSGTLEVIRLFLQKGADVNAADNFGYTPLIAAASIDDAEAAKLFIEKGASVNAQSKSGDIATALMGAAHNANLELTRLLLANKANINAVSADANAQVKNGPVAFGRVTALYMAVSSGSAEEVKLLLDAGAPIDPRDVRGMTPLMLAVATDRPRADIIRLLLSRGADSTIKSNIGESAQDWARKFNNPGVLSLLKLRPVKTEVPGNGLGISGAGTRTPQMAVERSLPLMQRASAAVFTEGGCVACHAQPVGGMAAQLALARGWHMEEAVGKSAAAETDRVVKSLAASALIMMQARENGGSPDTQIYQGMMMASIHAPANTGTDALVHYLAARQRAAGNWSGHGVNRAPMQDGDFSRTAMAVRTLAVYGMPGRQAELAGRVDHAADWLAAATPQSTEDRVMQILGLKWAGAKPQVQQQRTKELTALQRPDGGWAQTPWLASDAYATGQVLYMLHETDAAAKNSGVVRRGIEFLLSTQKEDGSWFVKSRAMKIQPYFQSGFPYDHDQWISEIGTAWAVIALSTAPDIPAVATKR